MIEKMVFKLADNLLNTSIKLKAGDDLLIEDIGKAGNELVNVLIEKAKEIGANPIVNEIDYIELKEFLINASEEEIIEYGKRDLDRMKKMNAYIGISSGIGNNELSKVPLDKMQMYNKYYTSPVHIQERVNNTKWCILRYPNEELAKKFNMSLEDFRIYFFKVCNLDYPKMSIAMDPLKELMSKTDKVYILGNGTNLKFSLKGIPAEKYYGTFNIPDGEVATCPVKNSVNGYITYNTETKYNGITFKNIKFEFKDGKIINATSNNTEELNKILDTDEGARYIGEFAFGLNPYIEKTIGDTLFDEKVNGSFHFTPGESLSESDNGNRSIIHWDIENIQRKEYGGGEIYFDDVLVMKDGRFVLPELQGLNPENLI